MADPISGKLVDIESQLEKARKRLEDGLALVNDAQNAIAEIQQAITELMMQVVGPRAQAFRPIRYDSFDEFMASAASRYFNFRKTSIYAGSNEIQRNIFAKMALGL